MLKIGLNWEIAFLVKMAFNHNKRQKQKNHFFKLFPYTRT